MQDFYEKISKLVLKRDFRQLLYYA